MDKTKKVIIFLIILSFLALPVILVADNIDSTYKYSWGENIGWMNWKPSYGGTDYGVTVYNECLTGYIWAENAGWTKVGDTSCAGGDCCQTGTIKGYENDSNGADNDGDGVADDWGVNNNGSGNLSGYAWGENVGWISFSCTNCNVNTSWRKVTVTVPGGGMPAEWFNPPKAPEGGFQILINEGKEYTDSRTVILNLIGGPDTARMAISNNSEFTGVGSTGQISYQSQYSWDICRGRTECPEGEYTIYAKFYTPWGTASEVVSDSIILKTVEKPITEMTIEELKAKIAEIKTMIAKLQAQLAELLKAQKGILYTVAKGETLWQIAKKYLGSGMRWKEIKTPEGVTFTEKTARELKVGQKLIIPQK